MSKITIIEGNSNDKDNVRAIMVKGEKGDMGDLNHNDIIDNLTSTATDKVLSAKQGKILKDLGLTVGSANCEIDLTFKHVRNAGFGKGLISNDEFINQGLRPEIFK